MTLTPLLGIISLTLSTTFSKNSAKQSQLQIKQRQKRGRSFAETARDHLSCCAVVVLPETPGETEGAQAFLHS